jgi:hypothetical protein
MHVDLHPLKSRALTTRISGDSSANGVKLRSPEGAQRPRASSASTSEFCSTLRRSHPVHVLRLLHFGVASLWRRKASSGSPGPRNRYRRRRRPQRTSALGEANKAARNNVPALSSVAQTSSRTDASRSGCEKAGYPETAALGEANKAARHVLPGRKLLHVQVLQQAAHQHQAPCTSTRSFSPASRTWSCRANLTNCASF